MEIRKARNLKEVDEAYELASKIFGPNYFDAKAVKKHARLLEPLRSLGDAIVAVSGQEIIGFLRILDRQFYSPVGILKAGGITSVCVHPEFQSQGLGSKMMDAALRRSRKRGDDFSILFARRAADGWYSKFGYVGIGCHFELQIEKPFVKNEHLAKFTVSFHRGIFEAYIDTYADAYMNTYGDLFLSVVRCANWWQTLEKRLWRRVENEDFINVLVDGSIIGYFVQNGGRVIEAACVCGHRADFIAALIQFHIETFAEKFVLALPSRHWCVEYLKRFNHTLQIRFSWDGGHMIRIIKDSAFNEITKWNANRTIHSIIDELFVRYSVDEHESAHRLLIAIVGAHPLDDYGRELGGKEFLENGLLTILPTWSIIDEF